MYIVCLIHWSVYGSWHRVVKLDLQDLSVYWLNTHDMLPCPGLFFPLSRSKTVQVCNQANHGCLISESVFHGRHHFSLWCYCMSLLMSSPVLVAVVHAAFVVRKFQPCLLRLQYLPVLPRLVFLFIFFDFLLEVCCCCYC